MQPMGVKGRTSNEQLEIRYNVLHMKFEPNSYRHTYSREEIIFINHHIQRFRLNDPKFRTRQLVDFLKNVIDNGGILQKQEYSNLIVQLFAEKLKEKTAKEKVEICSRIYAILFLKL